MRSNDSKEEERKKRRSREGKRKKERIKWSDGERGRRRGEVERARERLMNG